MAWNGKGNALIILNKYDEAINPYDKAIKINPYNSKAWYNKGVSLSKLGKFDKAIKAYDKAIKINQHNQKLGIIKEILSMI